MYYSDNQILSHAITSPSQGEGWSWGLMMTENVSVTFAKWMCYSKGLLTFLYSHPPSTTLGSNGGLSSSFPKDPISSFNLSPKTKHTTEIRETYKKLLRDSLDQSVEFSHSPAFSAFPDDFFCHPLRWQDNLVCGNFHTKGRKRKSCLEIVLEFSHWVSRPKEKKEHNWVSCIGHITSLSIQLVVT